MFKSTACDGEGQGSPVVTKVGVLLEWAPPLLVFPELGFLIGFWDVDVEYARKGSEVVLKSREGTYTERQVRSIST